MEDLRKVAKPTKDNWKLWVTIGNDLIDEYEEILGLSEPEIDDTGYRDKIRDSIISVKDMFALLEAESAFKKRQKRKDLDNRWNYWKKVILRAYKDVPGPAKDAYKNIIRRRDKIYFAATDSSDPALGGSSGFDSGTKSTGTFTGNADDVEKDAIKTDLENLPGQSGMGMQSQIDTSNRVSKDQKNRDGYLERIKNVVYVLDKNNLKKAISKGRAEVEDFLLTDRLPTKDIRKYTSKYYSLVAEKFGLQGLLFKGNIYFTDGSKEQADPNDETHKKIAQAQYELGALDNRDADKYVDMYGLNDLPKDSGMSQQMQAGKKGFKRDEVEWNGESVPALNKYNWRDWIKLGQALLDRIKNPSNEPLRGDPTESIRYTLSKLFEKIEMSDQDKANWKVLQQQFSKVGKELPPEAQQAYKDLQDQKRIIQFTDDLPGQSGMGMQSQIDPSNRVSKDQKDRDGYAERVKNLLYTFSADSGDLKNSVRKAKRDLRYIITQLPNKEAAKYSTMFYSELASKLGVQGLVRSDHIVFADGSKEKIDRNNDTHKEIVQAQFDLGLIDSTKANKLVDLFDLQDLPSSSGMSQQMKHGTKGFKNTGELKLKGTSKTLPPLTSKTVNDYVNTYLGILRKYKRGTGKGGGSIGMPLTYKQGKPTESKSYTIREHLNILLELESKNNNPNALKQPETAGLYNQQRSKIRDLDKKDLEAIENAFKTALQRKAIKPEEHTKFTKNIKDKEQLFKKLDAVPKMTKGDTPDTLKKAMAIKAPGSDKNYGVFNDQVMAVLNNPTPENLIKQAEAVSAMDLDGIDTDRMKFSAFYGHVANAMGLSGMITHRNSFMNSPMVVSAKARKTDFSDKMPEMLPFGEYSVEAVDFDNPRHKAVAQAQLNKNLLPASMQMSRNNTVDDVYKRFGITKQEPQEPERTGNDGPTVKSGLPGKSAKKDTTDNTQAAKQATADPALQPEPDAYQRPDFTGTRRELPPTDKLHYERFIPLPVEINSLLGLPKSMEYFVDRVRDSESNAGANLSDTLNIVSKKTAEGGSYNVARQISQDMSQAAYKAIIDMLKSRNLEFIDQAQADKFAQFKATNADLDANQGDPGETRDLWSQSQFGKDAIAKKQAAQDRKYNYDNPDGPDSSGSGVGSPGSQGSPIQSQPGDAVGTNKPRGKAVYHDIISSGGQMRRTTWAEYDANGEVVNKGKENEKYPGKLPSKNEYRNRQQAAHAGHSQGGQAAAGGPAKPAPEVTEKINAWRQAAKARGGTGKLRMLNYGNGTVAVVGEGVPKQNGLPVLLSAKMPKKVFLEQFGKYLNKDLSQATENKDFTKLLKNAGLLKEFY